MRHTTIVFILLIFNSTLIFSQNIKSVTINSQEDETIEDGLELQPNKYLFITRHGTFSDTLEMAWWEIFGYNSRLYVTDSNLVIEDSIDLLIPDYYTIAYNIRLIKDTVIILGRAIKTDRSEEHIFFSSFTNQLTNIQTGILGVQGNTEIFFDADTNAKGEIVITSISDNLSSAHHNRFIVTNNNKKLIEYIDDTISIGYGRIHYNIASNTYHLISAQSVSFYDTNFCKTGEKEFPFKDRFFNQFFVMPVNDYSYALQGIGLFKRKKRESGMDISYYLIDTGVSVIDSNYIYLPDTLDNAGGLDFITTDSIFMGGTHNTNWDFSCPPQFEPENHQLVLQCSNLYTNNNYWTIRFAGDGNYMMKNLFVTSNNTCIVMATYYNWQSNPVRERDILLYKINSKGLITSANGKPDPFTHYAFVYPNPGNNYFKVQVGTQHKQSVLKLIDMNGRVVLTKNIQGKTAQINATKLKAGNYVYTITNNNGLNEKGKWVKR